MSTELSPSARELHQQHLERRLRIAQKAVRDRPINLKFKNGVDPNEIIAVEKPVYKPKANPCVSATGGNWPSLEPWGALAIPVFLNKSVPPNFYYKIKKAVGDYFDVSVADIDGIQRALPYVIPRHVAMCLCKALISHSLPQIGRKFGGRDHTTVLNALRKMPKRMIKDSDLCQAVVELQAQLEVEIDRWRNSVCR